MSDRHQWVRADMVAGVIRARQADATKFRDRADNVCTESIYGHEINVLTGLLTSLSDLPTVTEHAPEQPAPASLRAERCPYCGLPLVSVQRDDHLAQCRTQRWWEVYAAMTASSTRVPPQDWVDARVDTAAKHLGGRDE